MLAAPAPTEPPHQPRRQPPAARARTVARVHQRRNRAGTTHRLGPVRARRPHGHGRSTGGQARRTDPGAAVPGHVAAAPSPHGAAQGLRWTSAPSSPSDWAANRWVSSTWSCATTRGRPWSYATRRSWPTAPRCQPGTGWSTRAVCERGRPAGGNWRREGGRSRRRSRDPRPCPRRVTRPTATGQSLVIMRGRDRTVAWAAPGAGVKCLHAHYAWHLAGGDDPVGRWVAERLAPS